MIYAEKENPSEEIFLRILESSKSSLISELKILKPLPNPTQFEFLVYEVMKEMAKGTEFEGTII